jgi:hypothetical protein
MKIVLSKIARTFEITVSDEYREPDLMYELTIRAVNGVVLSLKERK